MRIAISTLSLLGVLGTASFIIYHHPWTAWFFLILFLSILILSCLIVGKRADEQSYAWHLQGNAKNERTGQSGS